jgi:hypothetical protein
MWRKSGSKNRLILQAFNAGVRAARLDLPLTICPYPTVHEYRTAWEKGFYAERRNQRKRLRKPI